MKNKIKYIILNNSPEEAAEKILKLALNLPVSGTLSIADSKKAAWDYFEDRMQDGIPHSWDNEFEKAHIAGQDFVRRKFDIGRE